MRRYSTENLLNYRRDKLNLKFSEWPEKDRGFWEDLKRPRDLFEFSEGFRSWTKSTRLKRFRTYTKWLTFLKKLEPNSLNLDPIDRVSPERVRAFIENNRKLSHSTQFGYLMDLYVLARRMSSDRDLIWLKSLANIAQRQLRLNPGPEPPFIPSNELFYSGLRYFYAAHRRRPQCYDHRRGISVQARDGLMIALLAARPLRRQNFSCIHIDHNLIRQEQGYKLVFSPDETKTRKSFEVSVPYKLVEPIDLYLNHHRRILLRHKRSDKFWIGCYGKPLTDRGVAARIKKFTKQRFGVSLSMHVFRHCAATSIALADPDEVNVARTVLGHSRLTTTEQFYNLANSLEASQRYQSMILARRDELLKSEGNSLSAH